MSALSLESDELNLGVSLEQANVIVIEDEPLMGALIGRYLEQLNPLCPNFNIRYSLFEHGWDLLSAELGQVQVAIVDILLPKVTGVDLIKDFQIRYPHIRFVPISGMATEPFRRQLESLLPPEFSIVEKPLRPDAFAQAFLKALAYKNTTPLPTKFLDDDSEGPMWTAVPTNTSEIKVPTSHRKLRRRLSTEEN